MSSGDGLTPSGDTTPSQRPGLRRLAREPFVWFAILGTGFFLVHDHFTAAKSEIAVTPAIREALYADARLIMRQEPDASDKELLIKRYVDDEVLFREALNRGMHLGDAKVRARMIDLARFVLAGKTPEPTEEDMARYYAQNVDRYRLEASMTIDLEPLPESPAKAAPSEPRRLIRITNSVLQSLYGVDVAEKVAGLDPNTWSDAIATNQGNIRVRVIERFPESLMDYATAKDFVYEDIMDSASGRSLEQVLAELRAGYNITTPEAGK